MARGRRDSAAGLRGIGYEGQDQATFISSLLADEITVLVDVRLNAISRKPGFSKRGLASALNEAGISYVHRPELGNPKDNRQGFGGDGAAFDTAVATYAARLNNELAAAALEDLARTGTEHRVAVFCFEADDARCHRQVILSAAAAKVTAPGSRHRAR